jgi:oligogalacturonide lyase
MIRKHLLRALGLLALSSPLPALPASAEPGQEPPKSWIDPDTGHRVIRLTREPGTASLYFNINAYTPDGKDMVYTTADRGVGVLNLATGDTRELVPGPVGGGPGAVEVGHKTRTVFFLKATADPQYSELWSASIDTGETRKLASLPRRGGVFSVNADETLGVGSYIIGDGEDYGRRNASQTITTPKAAIRPLEEPFNKAEMMQTRLNAHYPMVMFTVDLATGKTHPFYASTDWLDHLQFSSTDPKLLMYAHQGPWQEVDKQWLIRIDGTGNRQIDSRIMENEGDGHQWWDTDGNIWWDLHFPLGGDVSYIEGYNVKTGERIWYHYQPNEASIHFNRSRDGTLFAGDGSQAPGAQWIYLFRAELYKNDRSLGEHLIHPGIFHAERLVNMSKTALHGAHNYRLEPNVSFTPDQKWVVFRSNIFGPTYAFAVEVAKAGATPADSAARP